jgi:hypothetical protein
LIDTMPRNTKPRKPYRPRPVSLDPVEDTIARVGLLPGSQRSMLNDPLQRTYAIGHAAGVAAERERWRQEILGSMPESRTNDYTTGAAEALDALLDTEPTPGAKAMTNHAPTPDLPDLGSLPEPFDYCYEWDGPYGTRKFSAAPHNGMKPHRSVPLYTADQMRTYAADCVRAALAHPAPAATVKESLTVAPAEPAERPCTCHPDDNPPQPCAKRYALAECKAAHAAVANVRAKRAP